MKLDVDPFPVNMVELEGKKILVWTDQAETTWGKNVVVSDELRRWRIKPRNPKIGTWKENISQKLALRVKPTSDMLIEKYVMKQQQQRREQAHIGRGKRGRSWSSDRRLEY
jgi:hypothetical protein